jgi:hypothetical protein
MPERRESFVRDDGDRGGDVPADANPLIVFLVALKRD